MKHIHSEVIHKWADGAEVQWRSSPASEWVSAKLPSFNTDFEYRVKPKLITKHLYLSVSKTGTLMMIPSEVHYNTTIVFDLGTGLPLKLEIDNETL